MDLPPAAADMYKTWWKWVNGWASSGLTAPGAVFTLPQVQSVASNVYPDFEGTVARYNPIGLSQLFSVARRIANSSVAVSTAPDSSPVTGAMVAEAPWSRSAVDQAVLPLWQARVSITYLDSAGIQLTGITTVTVPQILPTSIGSLRRQLELRVQDQLNTPPPTGTPRTGQLISIDRITLLQV